VSRGGLGLLTVLTGLVGGRRRKYSEGRQCRDRRDSRGSACRGWFRVARRAGRGDGQAVKGAYFLQLTGLNSDAA